MPHRFSPALTGKTIAWAVGAVVAVFSLTIGVLAAMPEPEADIRLSPAPEPSSEGEADPESAAADFMGGAGLAGEFGFALYDSAEDRYLLAYRPDDVHFSMSVSKVLIAVGALRAGADPSRVAEMISRSDDPIANELWGVVEGPVVIEELAEEMGLEHTTPSPDWGRWGDVLISASDIVRMYEFVLTGLPEGDRAVIVDAMAATTEFGSDGYDQTFGIPTAADGLDWAVKQGWGCCKPDLFLVSTGTIGPDHRYIAAVFGAWDEHEVSEEQAAREMTAVAEFLVGALPDPA
ncbi:hypothetical protein LO763_15100 [Glycomyces sp. A-F 0318]|uniref:hypothetical protein n=1 Tax=Glycomyces amatae TaxID=2881355 RepID=UPI001E581C2C|nr:hypothetical protein [Glycomyces amatae]MCD0444944.1 hypothetical protein [Glycomyces amatae]